MKISKSVISGNSANRYAGGIYDYSHSELTIVSSIVASNVAEHSGGGIYVNQGSSGELTLTSSLVVGNAAPTDPNHN
jgi:predicted outer membrane repeat protein